MRNWPDDYPYKKSGSLQKELRELSKDKEDALAVAADRLDDLEHENDTYTKLLKDALKDSWGGSGTDDVDWAVNRLIPKLRDESLDLKTTSMHLSWYVANDPDAVHAVMLKASENMIKAYLLLQEAQNAARELRKSSKKAKAKPKAAESRSFLPKGFDRNDPLGWLKT